jgi:hypothetical protein
MGKRILDRQSADGNSLALLPLCVRRGYAVNCIGVQKEIPKLTILVRALDAKWSIRPRALL